MVKLAMEGIERFHEVCCGTSLPPWESQQQLHEPVFADTFAILICFNYGKVNVYCVQPGCNFEQWSQRPFITKLTLCNKKPCGSCTVGIWILSRQKVFLHWLHAKCTCKSFSEQVQSVLHTEYLMEPEPSSMLWIKCLLWNKEMVRNRVDLSTVSNSSSISARLKACG